MVMLTSGSSERKYSHCSGRGQRLIRTSLLLMERSTERVTLMGTKVKPPCCLEADTQAHTGSSHPLQLLGQPGGGDSSPGQPVPLLTSKLILAVNGSSSASSRASSIFRDRGSDWCSGQMGHLDPRPGGSVSVCLSVAKVLN